MQASEEKIITRELKEVLKSAAGMLWVAGLGTVEICSLVRDATHQAFDEMEENAPTAKDQGGD